MTIAYISEGYILKRNTPQMNTYLKMLHTHMENTIFRRFVKIPQCSAM